MANVLEITAAEWGMVPGPSNILVLPQKIAPTQPLYPDLPVFSAHTYFDGPCPGGNCMGLMHDSVSGWWFGFALTSCDLNLTLNDGTVLDVHKWMAALVATHIDPITNQPWPMPNDPGASPLADRPWAQPSNWSGEYNWDYWTIACEHQDVILLQLRPPPKQPPPINPPPPIIPPPIIPPPPTNPPPPTTEPDPDGDEITYDLCLQFQGYTQQIIDALGGLASDPTCCQQVVAVLSDVDNTLSAIANNLSAIASKTGTPINWVPVSAGLSRVANAIAAIPPGSAVDLTPLTDAVNQVAKAISSAPSTDVSGIVKELEKIFKTIDVPLHVYQWAADQGYLSPAALQQLSTGDIGSGLTAGFWDFLHNAVIGAFKLIGVDITTTPPSFTPTFNVVADWLYQQVANYVKGSVNVLTPTLQSLIDDLQSTLRGTAAPAIGQTFTKPDAALAAVVTVAFNLWGAGAVLGLVDEGAGKALEKFADYFGTILGLEEIREVQIGPLVEFGMARDAEHAAKARFRQELPGNGELFSWVARGLMASAQARAIAAYNGLHDSLMPIAETAAESGLNPRMIIQALPTGRLTDADLRDELIFNGFRASSINRVLAVAPFLATRSERQALIAAAEAAYVHDLLDDAGLSAIVDNAEHITDRTTLILDAARLKKFTRHSAELEAAYLIELEGNITTPAAYEAKLAALGLQPDGISARAAVGEARLAARFLKAETVAAEKLQRQTIAAERKTAIKSFTDGVIDQPALSAALLLTGLSPTQVAAVVEQSTLAKRGALRWTYGLQLPPGAASLLRGRVSALTDQRKRLQIDDAQYSAALQTLGIGPPFLNALLAAAASLTTPKSAATVIPVQTN